MMHKNACGQNTDTHKKILSEAHIFIVAEGLCLADVSGWETLFALNLHHFPLVCNAAMIWSIVLLTRFLP